MDLGSLKEWILVVSGSATLLSIAASVWLGVQQYRLKLKAEERLARSEQAETDLRLLAAFVELIQDAAQTGRYRVSETLVKWLIDGGHLSKADLENTNAVREKVAWHATVADTVGETQCRMAVFAIGALAKRYDFLRELGVRALESKRVSDTDPEAAQTILQELRHLPGR